MLFGGPLQMPTALLCIAFCDSRQRNGWGGGGCFSEEEGE